MAQDQVTGYVIAIQNWYSLPASADFPSASVTSLDKTAKVGGESAEL